MRSIESKIEWYNQKNIYLRDLLKEIDVDSFLSELFERNNQDLNIQSQGIYEDLKPNIIYKKSCSNQKIKFLS